MKIIHISAECYPVAKVGGLADVVGALPKYQNNLSVETSVIMPFYDNAFTQKNDFESVYQNNIVLGLQEYKFEILKTCQPILDFDMFFVSVEELLFKDYVYSSDDTDRFLAFQIATLDWILASDKRPNYIHCHDHHTGLIPFMLQESYKYESLNKIPVITTIHNAQYQGWMTYRNLNKIPEFDIKNIGLLDWNGVINSLAAAIKCAWRVTTVSPSYMQELKHEANGLENLLADETKKCVGILNGIDTDVWNPETDTFLVKNFNIKTSKSGKNANKKKLCIDFNLDEAKPLFAFIGRLVGEKGTDILPKALDEVLKNKSISVLVLGSGQKDTETELLYLKSKYEGNYNTFIGYDEKLSHIIYAGADFLLMPSRVEPCGLNQMYALRYGTVPVVRSIGGLKDTIIDIKDDGFGFTHDNLTIEDIVNSIERAKEFYKQKRKFNANIKDIMQIDYSWEISAQSYINLYKSI